MKTYAALLITLPLLFATPSVADSAENLRLPWREAGLTEAQAAAHLLDRLAYGGRPGDVDRVAAMGLENWLAGQLSGNLPDAQVEGYLARLKSHGLSARQAAELYPDPGLVMREAAQAGVVDADMERTPRGERDSADMGERRKVMDWAREQGYRPMHELVGELMVQKLYRAVFSENQLEEVLTDFYYNHFNVAISDNRARPYVPSYERDAIRPFVLGSFRDMLEATAKHPAMLHYLDNARSVAPEGTRTTFDLESFRRARSGRRGGRFGARDRGRSGIDERRQQNRPQGLNENYARELMELHTLGVDGGYTQDDVVDVARAFTGWATYPPTPRREVEERIARARRYPEAGFVFEESFLFRADAHDATPKNVLGKQMPAGRGMEDGLEVLDRLAVHPSTARHLATKIATRFVSDKPPASLVNRLTETWHKSGGDLQAMIVVVASSPEFWSPEARRQKVKSPFEVAVSALRILDAEIPHPRATVEWITRMGQPLYAYQAPTGYPDRADAWVNSGSLLHRMNFGLELATGRIAGVRFDLAALNKNREPESMMAALHAYVPILLPERDPVATIQRLQRIVQDPELATKITSPLAHVVGVILGSPEFQRR